MNIAIVATTINGKIALSEKDNTSWGSKEDKKLFSKVTKQAGVIIFGKTTFETIKKTLPGRKNLVMTFDKAKELNEKYSNLENPPVFTSNQPKEVITKLKKEGFKNIFVCGGKSIYTIFLKEKLLDQIWVTIEPYIFNSGAIEFLGDIDIPLIKLKLIGVEKINDNSVNLKYEVIYE